MRILHLWIGIAVALSVAGCGGGGLTLSEYAAEVEHLVAQMEADFASIDADWESQPPLGRRRRGLLGGTSRDPT